MKRSVRFILMLSVILLAPQMALASPSDVPVQKQDSVYLDFYLTVQFPTIGDAPMFTASAIQKPLVSTHQKGSAEIRGEDLPRLVYSTEDAPGDLDALTVIIEGMPGTVATLDWTSYPKITLKPLDLRVRAYDKTMQGLNDQYQPIVDIILSDLSLGTDEVSVEGYSTAGYLDAEKLEAQLVFTTTLPDYEYPAYKKWLAGQPIIGELRVVMPNPFSKKNDE